MIDGPCIPHTFSATKAAPGDHGSNKEGDQLSQVSQKPKSILSCNKKLLVITEHHDEPTKGLMKPSTPNTLGMIGKERNITSIEKEFGAGRSSESKDVAQFNEVQNDATIWNVFVASDGEKDQTGGDSTNAAVIPDLSCDPRSTQANVLSLNPIGSTHMTQEDCAALFSPTTG